MFFSSKTSSLHSSFRDDRGIGAYWIAGIFNTLLLEAGPKNEKTLEIEHEKPETGQIWGKTCLNMVKLSNISIILYISWVSVSRHPPVFHQRRPSGIKSNFWKSPPQRWWFPSQTSIYLNSSPSDLVSCLSDERSIAMLVYQRLDGGIMMENQWWIHVFLIFFVTCDPVLLFQALHV